MEQINGSIVALVTPFNDLGEIDWQALEHLLQFHIQNGTHGIVVGGTTGESPVLEHDELAQLIKFTVEKVNGKIPIIAGAGCNSTQRSIDKLKIAEDNGVLAALVVTPYYNKPNQEGLLKHYQTLANSTDLPIILYNVPARTSCDLLPQTVAKLAKIENIVGIKEAISDCSRINELLNIQADNFSVYSGDDDTAVKSMLSGAKGVISVVANVTPKVFANLAKQCLCGHEKEALIQDKQLKPLYDAMSIDVNPIPVKYFLAKMGLIKNNFRLPLVPLNETNQAKVGSLLSMVAEMQ